MIALLALTLRGELLMAKAREDAEAMMKKAQPPPPATKKKK